MNRNLCFCFAMVLIRSGLAQSIAGPQQGAPGDALTFRLMNGSTQLTVDRWVQELNPDRYAGNDYISSFTLQMTASVDGTLTAVAPAPGRYKIAAWRGSTVRETYVLVRPPAPVMEIRGASFVANHSPLNSADKAYASNVFALSKKAGMNWAALNEAAYIDLDSTDLQAHIACVATSFCNGLATLEDLGWLIDEAHRQGLKVALYPNMYGRTKKIIAAGYFYVLQTSEGSVGDLPPFLLAFPSLIPAVMQSYAQYMLLMAQVAQQHQAEAVNVGNQSNIDNTSGSALWSQKDQWKAMFASMRAAFQGKIWVSFAQGCGSVTDLDIWTLGDYAAGGSPLIGPAPPCRGLNPPALDNLTAEQMVSNMSQGLDSTLTLRLQAASGLPLILTELFLNAIDGVARLASFAYTVKSRAVRDNQEIVDYFEASMRALAPRVSGLIFWAINVTPSSEYSGDVLRQPALLSAIANWWGGESAFLAPCLTPGPLPGVLLQDDFERGSCPMDRQETWMPTSDWQVIADYQTPGNHVLRSGLGNAAMVPDIGPLRWTDYELKLRVRIGSGGTNPGAFIWFHTDSGDGWNPYSVHVHQNFVGLYSPTQTLATQNYSGTPSQWHSVVISITGATINVTFDGASLFKVTDPAIALSRGAVALSTFSTDSTPPVIDFDDITVTALGPMLPTVSAGGILSAASLTPKTAVAPGSLVSVFGANLAAQSLLTGAESWPTWLGLGGASLSINSFPVPVYYVRSTVLLTRLR
jgi:hypothetical protein